MFKSLYDFFSSKTSNSAANSELAGDEVKLAAATLMFEVVRADGKINDAELHTMGEIIGQQFNIEDQDIQTMMELARDSSEEQISLQGFTRMVCDNWGNEKRVKLVEHLWIIALADKVIDTHERHLVRKVAGLLYLTDMQITRARENAKAALGIEGFSL